MISLIFPPAAAGITACSRQADNANPTMPTHPMPAAIALNMPKNCKKAIVPAAIKAIGTIAINNIRPIESSDSTDTAIDMIRCL
ncbi:hypothetical protein D9O50_16675 [Oxalobacteraceae bacterium CAVE-383]|nr:hypothetical protein D9O50_16675 [Oxalobacteraceae bacterium CAVE-383]